MRDLWLYLKIVRKGRDFCSKHCLRVQGFLPRFLAPSLLKSHPAQHPTNATKPNLEKPNLPKIKGLSWAGPSSPPACYFIGLSVRMKVQCTLYTVYCILSFKQRTNKKKNVGGRGEILTRIMNGAIDIYSEHFLKPALTTKNNGFINNFEICHQWLKGA